MKTETKTGMMLAIALAGLLLAGALFAAGATGLLQALAFKGSTGVTVKEFVVDTSPIDVLLMPPGQPVGENSHNMIVYFMAIAPQQYQPLTCHYSLDGAEPVKIDGCEPFALVNLEDGMHEIEVFAVSQGGEADSAIGQFSVNASGVPYPEPTITRFLQLQPYSGSFSVEYVVALANGTFASECYYSVDDAAPVSDPTCKGFEISGLEDGAHTLLVYVTDSAGSTGTAD